MQIPSGASYPYPRRCLPIAAIVNPAQQLTRDLNSAQRKDVRLPPKDDRNFVTKKVRSRPCVVDIQLNTVVTFDEASHVVELGRCAVEGSGRVESPLGARMKN